MKNLLTTLSLGLLIWASCDKKNPVAAPVFNCENFKAGILNDSSALVGAEVNKLCEDLLPAASTTADEYGQAQNINILIQRLSQKCNITATLVCYSCIETLPAQSEIRISINQNGVTCDRTLDISVTPQHMLTYVGMHE